MDDRTRYALYYVPAPGTALALFGRAVLGYDSDAGTAVATPPGLAGLAALSAGARVYGFHATLGAPLRLAPGRTEADLDAAVAGLAEGRAPVPVGPLAVALIGAFVALVPEGPAPAVDLLAAECTALLDPLRARLTDAERARRRPDRLDPRGRALLARWGYPHVFEAYRFHMTLTDALPESEREGWRARLAQAYGTPAPLAIEAVALLRQEGAAPFRVLARHPFAG